MVRVHGNSGDTILNFFHLILCELSMMSPEFQNYVLRVIRDPV